jgi:hypothetical protein
VIHQERRVGVLLAVEEARAVDPGRRVLACELEEDLVARDMRAGDHVHRVERDLGPEPGREGRERERVLASALWRLWRT